MLIRTAPGAMPAAASAASSNWRCVVDATWLTMVCTPPRLVATWPSRSPSQKADAGRAAAARRDGDDRAVRGPRAGVEQLAGERVLRVRGEARDSRPARPSGGPRAPRRRRSAVAQCRATRSGSVARPRCSRNASSGAEDAAEVDPGGADPRDEVDVADDDAAGGVGVPAEVLGRRVHDEVGALLQRPADRR